MTSTLPKIDEIIENFEFLEDWEDRFQYLIDLGKKVPPMPERELIDDNRVHGCQANVWLVLGVSGREGAPAAMSNGDGPPSGTVAVVANSDAHIVNGLIAVLMSLYNGMPLDEARAYDADALMARLGLSEHLSPTRRNGLHAMIERVKALAERANVA